MNSVIIKIEEILKKRKNCYIATTNHDFVDNALVAFYAENLTLYFGMFSNTLKGRFINKNNQVAICIDEVQIHGRAYQLNRSGDEFKRTITSYLKKFPNYAHFFEYENNELYKVDPMIVWLYDYHKGMMHREKIILDQEYYNTLNPYEPPSEFKRRTNQIKG